MRAIITASDYTENPFRVRWFGRLENGERLNYEFPAPIKPYYYLEDSKGTYKSINRKPLVKIAKDLPYQVKNDRLNYEKNGVQTYEADILFAERVLYDLHIKKAVDLDTLKPIDHNGINLRIASFDIETDDRHGFARPEEAKEEVTGISYYDYLTNNVLLFSTIPESKVQTSKLIDAIGDFNFRFLSFESEKEMIHAFFYLLSGKNAPDILGGWEIQGYDIPYLENRGRKFGLYAPFRQVGQLDFRLAYKRKHENNVISSSLDYVANLLLGVGKVKHKMGFYEMYEKDPILFLKYSYRDAILPALIDKNQGLTKFFYSLSCNAGTLQIGKYNADYIIDARLFHKISGKYIAPSKPKPIEKTKKGGGSLVFSAKSGMYKKYIIVLDFKGEYPAVISTLNLSHDTIRSEDDSFDPTDIIVDGYRFSTHIRGFIPETIDELMDERDKIKAEMRNVDPVMRDVLDNDQRTVKEITNAFYGDTKNSYSRWFDPRIQHCITFVARKHILWVADKVQLIGYVVDYGDTDSLFLSHPKYETMTKEEILEDALKLIKYINSTFPEFVKQFNADPTKSKLHMKLETIMDQWLQTGAKKKYVSHIIWEDKWLNKPKLKIRGFEIRRSDSSPYVHWIMDELFKMIFDDPEKARDLHHNELQKWIDHTIDINQIGFYSGLQRSLETYGNFQSARAIRNSIKEGIHLDSSQGKFRKYFVQGRKGENDVIMVNFDDPLPQKFISRLDWKYHQDRCFTSIVEPIMEVIGIRDHGIPEDMMETL